MSSCEKCWWDAHRLVRDGIETDIATAYHKLLKERDSNPCTPKEQAGQFWDEEKQIDIRLITNPEVDYNKTCDIEQQDFIEEFGNNGEELKDYPDDDPKEDR